MPELSTISYISEQKNDKFSHCAIALCSPMLRKRLLTTSVLYRNATQWARVTNNVKKPQSPMCESSGKLDLRFCQTKRKHFMFQSQV